MASIFARNLNGTHVRLRPFVTDGLGDETRIQFYQPGWRLLIDLRPEEARTLARAIMEHAGEEDE
jgi:hypothetical protein